MSAMFQIDRLAYYYTGFAILVASILGGGTNSDLWTDLVLFIVFSPFIGLAIARIDLLRMPSPAKIGCVIILVVLFIQFLPIEHPIVDPWYSDLLATAAPQTNVDTYWAPALNRSMYAALFTLTAMGFMSFINTLNEYKQSSIVKWFLIGASLNSVLAYMQRSYSGTYSESFFLPYEITFGFFANQNHFSAVAYCSVVFAGYHFLHIRKNFYLFIFFAAALNFVVFSYDSRAGFVIVSAASVFSYFVFGRKFEKNFLSYLSGVAFIILVVTLFTVNFQSLDDVVRLELNRDVSSIALHYFPFGSGLGSFESLYPAIVDANETRSVYFRYAHNDILQLVLELGLPFILIVIFLAISIFISRTNSDLFYMAVAILVFLSFHSFFDYPLRTYYLATILAFSISICCSGTVRGKRA